MTVSASEGTVPFEHPTLTKPCQTWYKVWGDLNSSSTGRPLICIHGGPGMGHNYLLPMQDLAHNHGITVVMYDQIGCGNSTRLPEKRLDHKFWQPELFMSELVNLLRHLGIQEYDLLGQSWGGMLSAQFAINRPAGLNRLVISNSPASMLLWVESCNEWRRELPPAIDEALTKYEERQEYDNQEYQDAVQFFYQRHFCRKVGDGDPFPPPVMQSLKLLEGDDTVYYTMQVGCADCQFLGLTLYRNGPSEFTVIGNLKGWTVVDHVHKIQATTLVLNGSYDEARNVCVAPFAQRIPGAVWKTIEDTSHCGHVEKPEEYCSIVAEFLLPGTKSNKAE